MYQSDPTEAFEFQGSRYEWSENQGAKTKSTIEEAAKEIASLIMLDLNGKQVHSVETIDKGYDSQITISEDEERMRKTVRSRRGYIRSMPINKF